MSKIEKQIERIKVNKGNFEHIAQTGDINGNLYADLLAILSDHAADEVKTFKDSLVFQIGVLMLKGEISEVQEKSLLTLIEKLALPTT